MQIKAARGLASCCMGTDAVAFPGVLDSPDHALLGARYVGFAQVPNVGFAQVPNDSYPRYGWDFPEEILEKVRKDPGNALRSFPGTPRECG